MHLWPRIARIFKNYCKSEEEKTLFKVTAIRGSCKKIDFSSPSTYNKVLIKKKVLEILRGERKMDFMHQGDLGSLVNGAGGQKVKET